MYLNTLKPALGAKTKAHRLGRGIGSGLGKTSGKGHKGQKARAGGYHKRRIGFEGGQTPLKRRLPKFGFYSHMSAERVEIRLSDLEKLAVKDITLEVLRTHKLINAHIQRVKVIRQGKITRSVALKGLGVTKGAREAILACGGSVE